MEEILRSSLPVLLDSGAFSEVAVRDGGIELASPITNQEWKRRLAIYLRIARASSPRRSGLNSVARVTVVAPDRVGSQELTLARLTQFRAEMREVHLAGADILVPLQVGLLGLPEFYDAAAKVIGIGIVPACR